MRIVGAPAFVIAGLLLLVAVRRDVAEASNFNGNRRALNTGVAALELIGVALGIGILAQ